MVEAGAGAEEEGGVRRVEVCFSEGDAGYGGCKGGVRGDVRGLKGKGRKSKKQCPANGKGIERRIATRCGE